MNKQKIELIELGKNQKLEYTDLLQEVVLKRVYYQEQLVKKTLTTKLFRLVCLIKKLQIRSVTAHYKS
jgi:hypothetical protein